MRPRPAQDAQARGRSFSLNAKERILASFTSTIAANGCYPAKDKRSVAYSFDRSIATATSDENSKRGFCSLRLSLNLRVIPIKILQKAESIGYNRLSSATAADFTTVNGSLGYGSSSWSNT